MALKTVTLAIDVPEGFNVAGHRLPRRGDWVRDSNGLLKEVHTDWNSLNPERIVFVPEWQWPVWLKAPWIAMNSHRLWRWFATKPDLDEGIWLPTSGSHGPIPLEIFDFTPPPCEDWRQSLRKNPNR